MPTPYADTLDVDLAGDRDVWARQIVKSQKRRRKHPPRNVNLEQAITGIRVTDTIVGASTIEVDVLDPGWALTDSRFFYDVGDGKLDPIEINYPDESRLWWRLTQVDLDWGPDVRLKLTFMERSAVYLMLHHGPVKTSRGKKTRAEFIKSLTDRVQAGGGITFQSIALHKKQDLQHTKAGKDPDLAEGAKTGGVHRDDNLKVKGIDVVAEQIRKINLVNDVVFEENASERVALAINCAAISESRYGMDLGSRGTTFQTHEFSESQIKKQAYYFLHGGRSFASPGAIGLAKAHRDWSPGEIAMVVEGSISNFGTRAAGIAFYNKYRAEAQAIVDAYGQLGSNSTEERRKQYNFRVGDEDDPYETFWDAILRLADEVKWAFFMDGNWAYFDTEKTLIMQKPAAVIARDNAAVVGFNCTLDNRDIATEATLSLICDPFSFRAGEVIKLVDFGPASMISTATSGGKPAYPGRWLIQEIERDVFELVSSFTLKQPQQRLLEPDDAGTITVETPSSSASDLLTWAKTQLGTTEGSRKQIDYAKTLGYSASLPWCSIFVAYGLKRVDHDVKLPPNPAYSGAWLDWEGGTKVNKSSMIAGDLVIFDWGDGGITDHVAIYAGKSQVIGGNQGNRVSKVPLSRPNIVGVVRPNASTS
jgi:uncharacterized protein (TIGR02594 family)